MTCHVVVGVIIYLQQCSIKGFMCVWYIFHQLYIILQKLYLKLNGGAWYTTLVYMISHRFYNRSLLTR